MQGMTLSRRRGAARKGLLLALAATALLGAAGVGYWYYRHEQAADQVVAVAKYTCGMHPWIIADKPGDCPICGMKLTKIEEQLGAPLTPVAPAPSSAAGERRDFFADLGPAGAANGAKKPQGRGLLFYRNPMDPNITSPVPAKDEMGMDYVPVYADEVSPAREAAVPGLVTVRVGEESLRVAGLQTSPAVRQSLNRTVRTVGIVTPDEGRIRHVHTKIAGWVEHLSVNFTGQTVERGQPILSLYSPELLASQEEFLKARETAAKFASSSSPEVRTLGDELLAAARRRLELFDVPESFIEELGREGKPRRTVTLNAPSSGFVTSKGIFEGQEVQPGMELFTVTDLSRVWIEADLYEYEAQAVRVGQQATLTLPYDPGLVLQGRVSFVYPYLSPESRTLKVRFDFPNPNLTLKPAMYVDVTLALESAEGIVIPDSAVMDTGVRRVVFVEVSTGTFEPRIVKLGVRGDGRAQVLAGVEEGEKVVVKANFLVDSESRLRAALTKLAGDAR
jgi:RND family efflux transporter MFP subunit